MFLVFECTVGMFYPSYGVIKSEKIPEDIRSAVMNIFRMPLNAFVVLLLLKIKYLSPQVVFVICTAAHLLSILSYMYFYMHSRSEGKSGSAMTRASPIPMGRQSSELEMHLRETDTKDVV